MQISKVWFHHRLSTQIIWITTKAYYLRMIYNKIFLSIGSKTKVCIILKESRRSNFNEKILLYTIHRNYPQVVGKWRIKRENFFGPFSAIFIPDCHFYSWLPFWPLSACSPRVPWRIKRENFFGPFSAIFIPGLLFFNLAAYFYLVSFLGHFLPLSTRLPRVPWRIKREPIVCQFGYCLPFILW